MASARSAKKPRIGVFSGYDPRPWVMNDCAANDIAVLDLYAYALARLDQIQQPVNVHFTRDGSRMLADEVAGRVVGFMMLALAIFGGGALESEAV